MLLIQEAPFSVKNPSVSSVASVRYLLFGADATEAEPVQKVTHREYLFKIGLVFDNGEGAKQREFHRLLAK
jgi:hypothetical protein